ncbi:ATP-binding protein [Hylemonella gracilis]|uniref:histidine kinase n=1 Tax=Hylemonella gracilis ATCC 19624 TaxID=887062 RepID=F3KPT9_9BURK|nr:ATP-binding protein [Hylemonella gracilis]EGI78107.1 pas/pac sensor hybrid histidine kinase [Hylemonella gracilis ATCC 19624]
MQNRTSLMRYAVILAGVAFTLVFAGSSAYDAWYQRDQIYQASERELGNFSRLLAVETERSLQTVNVLLRDTAWWYQQQGHRLPDVDINRTLTTLSELVPQVAMLNLIDAGGAQRYRSSPLSTRPADFTQRPYFQVHRDNEDAGLYINAPLFSQAIGRMGLVMSRRVNDAQGRFAGVVSATVRLDQLCATYDSIDFGSQTEMHVTFLDGTPLITPSQRSDGPLSLPPTPVQTGLDGLVPPDDGGLHLRRLNDGRPRVVAAARVPGHPLVIYLSRDEAEILRGWHTETQHMLVRTLILAVCVLISVLLALRQLRKLDQHEQALSLSEQRYALVMEAANEGHAEWDLQQDTIYLSPRWREMHFLADGDDLSFEQFRAMTRVHPDDRDVLIAAMQTHLRGDARFFEAEYRVKDGQGDWHWIHARGCVHGDAIQDCFRFYWTTRDVSHRKAAEVEKRQLEAKLLRARHLESLGTMAGGIAHDFNNILGAILGYGEMAQRLAEPESTQARYLDRVMQAGQRAKALVRRIIDFSRSGYGEKTRVAVQPLVEEAMTLLAPTLPEGVELRPRLSAPRAAILGEVSQLHQIVMNLCTNAIAAIDGQGTVTVSLSQQHIQTDTHCCHGVLKIGDYVRLQVQDTGRGMEAQTLDRAFDPFFTTRPVGEGAGLGLSVVHGIVAELGGTIDVVSELGRGSTFTIWLPSQGELDAVPQEPPPPPPMGRGETLMVVDDEPALVELLEDSLAALGYEAVGYTSSTKALQAFQADADRFDLVLTDQQLPELSGAELIARLRVLRPLLPVVLMTGHGGAGLEPRIQSVNIDAVLHKPVSARDIAVCIARVLKSASDRRARVDTVWAPHEGDGAHTSDPGEAR